MTARPEPGGDTRARLAADIAVLLRSPGVRRSYRASAVFEDLGNSDVTVTGPVEAQLVLEAAADDVVVTGTLVAPWTGVCRRCLGEVTGELAVDVREIFEPRPTEGETYLRGDDEVVLDPMVREAVVLALPVAPLCGDDCRGPDPDRYPAEPVGDAAPPPDPRWAALDDLRLDEDD